MKHIEEVLKAAEILQQYCEEQQDCYTCAFASEKVFPCGLSICDICNPKDSMNLKSKKRVPFDLSLKKDRDALRGKWLKKKESDDEYPIIGFSAACAVFAEDVVMNRGKGTSRSFGTGDELFEQFIFADTGLPVGKEVMK